MNPSHDSSSPSPDASQPNEANLPDASDAREADSSDKQQSTRQPDPEQLDSEQLEITQSLNDLEESLQTLKRRYADVLSAKTQRSELRAQYNRTQSELSRHRTAQLKSEMKDLQQKLNDVEVTLESQLFSWSSLKEPFWMAVRFGGLGILIGWLLRSLAG